MKNIDAGALRHRVTVSRISSRAADAAGQVISTDGAIGTYYALVECLGGAETTNAGQLKGTLKYRVTLRAAAGPIRPTDKILWNNHVLKVVAATPDPFGILIEVDAVEYGVQ